MKKLLALFLALLLIVGCLPGCGEVLSVITAPDVDLSYPFIGFRTERPEGTVDLEGYTRLTPEQINAHVPSYSGYGVSLYYDTLGPQEQQIYRIFQYAMDYTYPVVFIDDRLLEDDNIDIGAILDCMALDNPMVEQNIYWRAWEAECTYPNNNRFDKTQPTALYGTIIENPVFSRMTLDKKLLAKTRANEIIQHMPDGLTDLEKCQYFYDYLGNHVEYYTTEDHTQLRDYLYEALLEGKTNCDGYANAFSLLCYLSGVTCAEKMYSPTPEEEDETGHTWNAVQLDGVWYNVDATASREVNDKYVTMRHFCFADKYLDYRVDMSDRAPASEKSLIEPDVTITSSGKAGSQVKKAWKTVKKTGRKYVLAEFPNGEQKSSVLQKIANSLGTTINTVHYVTKSGTALYYIFPKK